jgi:CRP-like cAMP-binding protein
MTRSETHHDATGLTHGRVGSPFLGLFLRRRNELTPTVMATLPSVPVERMIFEDGQTIAGPGTVGTRSCLLIRGVSVRMHPTGTGPGGISSICLPGDFMDLHAFLLNNLDHAIVSVGRTVVEMIQHDVIQRLIEAHPEIGRAFWRETLVDAKMHRNWVVAGSFLQAGQRVAHLLCEMEYRLARVGLSDDAHFNTPLDQKTVSRVLGLSTVHLNRAVQELRSTGLVKWRGRTVHLPDVPAIRDFARFDPAYLEP